MIVYLWLGIGGVLLTAGDVVFKFWVLKPIGWTYGGGIALYILGIMCLVETYKTENIATATAIFVIANILTLAIVSTLFFNEPLTTKQLTGVLLAGLAVFLLR